MGCFGVVRGWSGGLSIEATFVYGVWWIVGRGRGWRRGGALKFRAFSGAPTTSVESPWTVPPWSRPTLSTTLQLLSHPVCTSRGCPSPLPALEPPPRRRPRSCYPMSAPHVILLDENPQDRVTQEYAAPVSILRSACTRGKWSRIGLPRIQCASLWTRAARVPTLVYTYI